MLKISQTEAFGNLYHKLKALWSKTNKDIFIVFPGFRDWTIPLIQTVHLNIHCLDLGLPETMPRASSPPFPWLAERLTSKLHTQMNIIDHDHKWIQTVARPLLKSAEVGLTKRKLSTSGNFRQWISHQDSPSRTIVVRWGLGVNKPTIAHKVSPLSVACTEYDS